jgi:hypothetical protein
MRSPKRGLISSTPDILGHVTSPLPHVPAHSEVDQTRDCRMRRRKNLESAARTYGGTDVTPSAVRIEVRFETSTSALGSAPRPPVLAKVQPRRRP